MMNNTEKKQTQHLSKNLINQTYKKTKKKYNNNQYNTKRTINQLNNKTKVGQKTKNTMKS